MLPSIVIIICSMGLLVYWFRYTCILLVRNCAEEAAFLECRSRAEQLQLRGDSGPFSGGEYD